jgi:tetratricopeptide (TPR) repeat protein
MRILEINNSIVKATVKHLSLFAITILMVSSATFGQTTKLIDSLESELKKEKSVARSIDLMVGLASAYSFVDFPKSIKYAKEAVELANRTDQALIKYRANQQLSMSYTLAGDYTSALKYETIALQIALNAADSSSLGLSHSNIGNLYFEIGEYDEAYF